MPRTAIGALVLFCASSNLSLYDMKCVYVLVGEDLVIHSRPVRGLLDVARCLSRALSYQRHCIIPFISSL